MLRSETVEQLADLYMNEHCKCRCKASTIASHEWPLKTFIKPEPGGRKLLDLRPTDVAKLHADLRKTPCNAVQVLGLLRAVLNRTERWEMPNPAPRFRG